MTFNVKGEEFHAAVRGLLEARATGWAPESVARLDVDLDSALHLQLATLDRLVAGGEVLAGWKVGLTSGAARQMMGGFRPFGYLLTSRVLESGSSLPLGCLSRCLIEAELCLVLGADLRGPVDAETAMRAVGAVVPAFEINQLRLPAGATHAAMVADGVANWGIAVGHGSPVRSGLADTHVEVFARGERIAEATPGDSLDDPFASLAALSAKLDRFGRGLIAGQRVITGAFTVHPVEGPGIWRADFAGIGSVELTFA